MTRAEFWEVVRILRPDISWPRYWTMWASFQRAKLQHRIKTAWQAR